MKDLKIGFFGVKSWERKIIEKEITDIDATGIGIFEHEVQDKIDVAKKYDIISVFIYSKMDSVVLDQLPNLKMIATRSTGTDHIDSEACKKRNVIVKNVATYGENTVAEYAIALLLAVAKRIVPAHQSVEDGEFSPEGLSGVDLFGKTLGVIGVGRIGRNVVRMAKGLGMKIIGVEKTPDLQLAKKLGFKYADLETCLKEADFVTLHVPAVADTVHLINRQNIKLMKKGSILINTSRGAVVESEAIVWALNQKILIGAGLDVAEKENELESISMIMNPGPSHEDLRQVLSYHMLRDRDDVVFTPHNAFNTKEAIERIVQTTIKNINDYLSDS